MSHTVPVALCWNSRKWFPPPMVPSERNPRSMRVPERLVAIEGVRARMRSSPGSSRFAWVFATTCLVHVGPDRDLLLDRASGLAEAARQVLDAAVELDREHAAADIDADRGRDDGRAGRDDGADGGSDPQVHIRHGSDVRADARELRGCNELLRRVVRHVVRPKAHRARALSLHGVHCLGPLECEAVPRSPQFSPVPSSRLRSAYAISEPTVVRTATPGRSGGRRGCLLAHELHRRRGIR